MQKHSTHKTASGFTLIELLIVIAIIGILAAIAIPRAAEQGNKFVARNLGGHYAGGYGIEKDNIQAYKWFSIAAINGDEDSQKYKQRLEEEMTPIQVAEAQELARKWIKKWEGKSKPI